VDLNDTPETLSDSCDARSAGAHGFDDLGRYVTWLLDQPSSAYLFDRLAAEASRRSAQPDVVCLPRMPHMGHCRLDTMNRSS
jgi:hypothetical protein